MSQREPAKTPLICSECDAAMNQHAVKIDYSAGGSTEDAVFGGALQEVHTCPHCGQTELRQV